MKNHICMSKGCDFNIMLNEVDDGEKRVILCQNHTLLFAYDQQRVEYKEGYPLPSEEKEQVDICGCCDQKSISVMEDLDLDKRRWNICLDHFNKLLTRNLNPTDFHLLLEKYGDVYLLHDDFYDLETGKALQPLR